MSNKLFHLITLILIAVFVFTACSPQPATAPSEAEPAEEAQEVAEEEADEAAEAEEPEIAEEELPSSMYNEAPLFADKVASGELPPVDERLPENPLVIEPFEETGTYGGTLRVVHFWPGAESTKMILNDPPVILTPDYTEAVANLFENTGEYSNDGLTLTWKLRKGLKWSDGQPYTTHDFMWWWDNMVNDERCASPVNPFFYVGGDPATQTPPSLLDLEAPDEYTLVMNLPDKNYVTHTIWASGYWEFMETNMVPAHYLEQFHPDFSDQPDCSKLIEVKNNWFFDPEYPVLTAWRTIEVVSGEKVLLERNPYYWKVDSEGNQLPYIDYFESRFVPDQQVRTLMAINGEIDYAVRAHDPRDRSLILESADKCDCRVLDWETGAGSNPLVYINGNYIGNVEGMADLLRNSDFKRGLSHAINRERILNTVWNGLGYVTGGDMVHASFAFDIPDDNLAQDTWEAWNQAYSEFDADLANDLLDKAGLDQRDDDGFRTMPDGSKLELELLVTDWEFEEVNANTAALIKEDWGEVGLRVITPSATGDVYFNFAQNAEWQFFLSQSGAFGEWLFPSHIFESLDNSKCFPLVGQWWQSGGEQGQPPIPDSPEAKLIQIYQKTLVEPDANVRGELLAEAVQVHIDEGPFKLGIVANQPALAIASNKLQNVYGWGLTSPWSPGSPGSAIPSQMFFKE